MKFKKRTSPKITLRTTLVVSFVVQIVAAVGFTGWLSFRNGQQSVDKLVNQISDEVTARVAEHIKNFSNTSYQFLQINLATIQSGDFNLSDYPAMADLFWEQTQISEAVPYLYFANPQGDFVGCCLQRENGKTLQIRDSSTRPYREVYQLDFRGKPQALIEQDLYDPRIRPWYQEVVEAQQPTWSSIYLFAASPQLGITQAVPIYDDLDTLLGVLAIDLTLSDISEFLRQLNISESGVVFIVERTGEIVASSTTETPFLNTETGKTRLAAVESNSPLIQGATEYLLTEYGPLEEINSSDRFIFHRNGSPKFLQVTPIQDEQGLDWLMVVVIPKLDFTAQINNNTRKAILLCTVALAVSTICGLITSRWIATSIANIASASDKMAQGHLDQQVNGNPICEIDLLAASFNKMAGQLKESFATLEEKVQERTAELASANEQISALNEKLKAENLRMGAELDVARQIQQLVSPNPEELQNIQGLDLAGYTDPADEVGGDYYDVLEIDGIVTLSIGDVAGHGLESGLLMLMTQMGVRTLKEVREHDPIRFLDTLNRAIYRNIQRMNSQKNLTLAILNYSKGRLSISGQHEETLLVRANGIVERIDTIDLGLPLGMDDNIAEFLDHTLVELETGDGIVLYTDGIPEAANLDKQRYGMERFCNVISQHWSGTAQEIKQAIIEDLREFIGAQKVFDDITLLVLKQL